MKASLQYPVEEPVKSVALELKKLFQGKPFDAGHGFEHMLKVWWHAKQALAVAPTMIPESERIAVELAALLHDADDHKLFPASKDYDNAREILERVRVKPEICALVIEMIALVSCSTNGNERDPELPEYMYYPRFADRLEALGKIGIYRCFVYSRHVNRPDFTAETLRATTMEELKECASKERFENYVSKRSQIGESTFIDHFYDKLLHIGDFDCENSYLCKKAQKRLGTMERFVLEFGQTGQLPLSLSGIVEKYSK